MVELRGFALSKTSLYSRSWFNMVSIFCYTVYYTVDRVSVPLRLTDLARPVPGLNGLLPGVVVDHILRRYLLRPAAGGSMERLLVDTGTYCGAARAAAAKRRTARAERARRGSMGGPLYCSKAGLWH